MEKDTSSIIKYFLFLDVFCLSHILYSQEKNEKSLSEDERIFSVVFRTDAKTQASRNDWRKKTKVEEITYLIRMPAAWTKEKNEMAKKSKTPCVRGVIAICTWDKEPEKMRKNLSYWNSEFKHLIQFADNNNIAVITWTNFGGYLISTSSDEMTSGIIGSSTYRKCEKIDNPNHTCTDNVDYCPTGKYVCRWIPYSNPERICEAVYESDGGFEVKGCK